MDSLYAVKTATVGRNLRQAGQKWKFLYHTLPILQLKSTCQTEESGSLEGDHPLHHNVIMYFILQITTFIYLVPLSFII